MKIYKVTTKTKTVIGYYESYSLADFHCTSKLYTITPIEVITKSDMAKMVLDLEAVQA